MKELNTVLLRERFIISDSMLDIDSPEAPAPAMVAASNRIELPLLNRDGGLEETIIVRAQNMHSCVRMASRIVQSFEHSGRLTGPHTHYDWQGTWDSIINDYEYSFNPQRWVAIYNQGRLLFSCGSYPAFVDVIENCAFNGGGEYRTAIAMAEDVFKKNGKTISIAYEDNYALTVGLAQDNGRCGLIIRGPGRTTVFNFQARPRRQADKLHFPQILGACAAFLEALQLCFLIGINDAKTKRGLIARQSREERQTREARDRLQRLNEEISALEEAAEVHYRPERPYFAHIIADAEKRAAQTLAQS